MVRRGLAGSGLLITMLVVMLTIGAGSATARASCSDSWGSDGHPGPWYIGTTQTLHGNTVVISCPSGSTPWSIDYQVCKSAGTTCDFTPIDAPQTGTGSASFNFSRGPIGCNQGWDYWTHIHNNVTGGDISKPFGHLDVIC